MPAVQRTGQSGTGMAITIKTGVVYYTMLEYVKKNLDFHTNRRASGAYRKHIAGVLTKRCILALNGGN